MSRSCHSATFSSAGVTAMRTSARGRSGSRSAPGCACAASPTSPSGPGRNIPRPRALRCAAGGGSRWRAARSSCDHAERREIHGVAVARDHLGRDRLGHRGPSSRRHALRPADRYWRRCRPRRKWRRWRFRRGRATSRGPAAGEFGIGLGELEAEGGGLGMDAVAAADGERVFVLDRARFFSAASSASRSASRMSRARVELDGEAGVEHVRGGHALVDEARVRPDDARRDGSGRR